MTRTRPFSELAAPILADPVRRARVEEVHRAMRVGIALGKLREQHETDQPEVVDEIDVSENIIRIEHEDGLYLSTIRWCVHELGGTLEVRAVFPDDQIVCFEDVAATESGDSE